MKGHREANPAGALGWTGKQLFRKQNGQDHPWVAFGVDGLVPPVTGVRNWGWGKLIWGEMIGVPWDEAVGDLVDSRWGCPGTTGERFWLEPHPGNHQQEEVVTEALAFGTIVQQLDSSGKAKERAAGK